MSERHFGPGVSWDVKVGQLDQMFSVMTSHIHAARRMSKGMPGFLLANTFALGFPEKAFALLFDFLQVI